MKPGTVQILKRMSNLHQFYVCQRVSPLVLGLFLIGCGGGDVVPVSEEKAIFDLLNSERSRCGFGELIPNAQLDDAARKHADYQLRNNLFTHVQDGLRYPNGFSGELPADRVLASGYLDAGGVADETVRFSGTAKKAGLGVRGLRDLLNAPYHLRGLMGGYRDVGISVRSSAEAGGAANAVILQINAAYKSSIGRAPLTGQDIATYPCEGSTGVNRQLTNETPNPIPGRDLATQPLGSVIYLSTQVGKNLAISSVSMTELSTGRAIPLMPPVTALNDPYRYCQEGCFEPHEAYVAAQSPLTANTSYRVTLSASSDGRALTKTFTFMTGTGG